MYYYYYYSSSSSFSSGLQKWNFKTLLASVHTLHPIVKANFLSNWIFTARLNNAPKKIQGVQYVESSISILNKNIWLYISVHYKAKTVRRRLQRKKDEFTMGIFRSSPFFFPSAPFATQGFKIIHHRRAAVSALAPFQALSLMMVLFGLNGKS